MKEQSWEGLKEATLGTSIPERTGKEENPT